MTREAELLIDMWNTLHKECHKVVTEENYDVIKKAIQALSQEPNRDMEEIAEVMKSDADAETKCKMISNILIAKPHYFELSQEPCEDTISTKLSEIRERIEDYVCNQEENTMKAQGMLNALRIMEEVWEGETDVT